MLNTKFSPWPSYTKEEAEAVSNVLLSNKVNYWTGNESRSFEKEFAEWTGTKYAIALMNGTVAIDLALIALGIGKGDEVIVTSRTFLASVSSIINAGATPAFADVSRDSQNITPESISTVITPKTKAIVAVHLAGWPCEMDGIMEIAKKHNLKIIEDCAQAHGAKYKGKSVGSVGDVGAWSFCQDKIMTTGGEGGMVTTNSKDLWTKMWSFKDHGKSWQKVYETDHPPGFRWVHDSFGTNWRITEMQSVIGRIQLRRMKDWQAARTKNALKLSEACRTIPSLRIPEIPPHIDHAWYKFYAFFYTDHLNDGWDKERIIEEINALGVPCYSGSCSEVYLEKAFEGTTFRPLRPLPVAQELGETSLMFLVHPTLTPEEIDNTCEVIKLVASKAFKKIHH